MAPCPDPGEYFQAISALKSLPGQSPLPCQDMPGLPRRICKMAWDIHADVALVV